MQDSAVIVLCILAAAAVVTIGFAVFRFYQKGQQSYNGSFEGCEENSQAEYRRQVRYRNQLNIEQVWYEEYGHESGHGSGYGDDGLHHPSLVIEED